MKMRQVRRRSAVVILIAVTAIWAGGRALDAQAQASAQSAKRDAPPKRIALRAGRLIDGKSDTPISNAVVLIEGDKIVSVTAGGPAPAGAELIDLSRATVMPGFTDVHTHVVLKATSRPKITTRSC